MPAPHSQALRQGRISLTGQIYLVTTTVRDRRPLFTDWRLASTAARFTNGTILGDGRFLAWVLMPDHFHGLLVLGSALDLSKTVQRFKGNIALAINRMTSASGSLWQPGFHDRAVRREQDLRAIARYVVANPLRAGLVKRIGDYPFWNAEWIG